MSEWMSFIEQDLHNKKEHSLIRHLCPVEDAHKPVLTVGLNTYINLSSNNYLGLANHPDIISAMVRGAAHGSSAAASKLVIGHSSAQQELEAEIASFKKTDAALLFANGYMANVGAIACLLNRGDAVFSDRLNHASIYDGIKLSQAKLLRYNHRDLNHLEQHLQKSDNKKKHIITDTVFSMDGDIAPLKELVWLKERYGAMLMVDEAHGTGVFGPQGNGVAHQQGIAEKIDLHMGTFSKSFGVYGAYIAGNRNWIDYIVNNCRTLIYTTGLPPAIVYGIKKSLQLVESGDALRTRLHEHSTYFRRIIKSMGLNTGASQSPIIPLILGDADLTLQFSDQLQKYGIMAVAIRPPTVPVHTSRIRFSLMATHTREQLDKTLEAIREIEKKLRITV